MELWISSNLYTTILDSNPMRLEYNQHGVLKKIKIFLLKKIKLIPCIF